MGFALSFWEGFGDDRQDAQHPLTIQESTFFGISPLRTIFNMIQCMFLVLRFLALWETPPLPSKKTEPHTPKPWTQDPYCNAHGIGYAFYSMGVSENRGH